MRNSTSISICKWIMYVFYKWHRIKNLFHAGNYILFVFEASYHLLPWMMIVLFHIAGGTKFAKCFICKEIGHLSKSCPKNTHGVYPKVFLSKLFVGFLFYKCRVSCILGKQTTYIWCGCLLVYDSIHCSNLFLKEIRHLEFLFSFVCSLYRVVVAKYVVV